MGPDNQRSGSSLTPDPDGGPLAGEATVGEERKGLMLAVPSFNVVSL